MAKMNRSTAPSPAPIPAKTTPPPTPAAASPHKATDPLAQKFGAKPGSWLWLATNDRTRERRYWERDRYNVDELAHKGILIPVEG